MQGFLHTVHQNLDSRERRHVEMGRKLPPCQSLCSTNHFQRSLCSTPNLGQSPSIILILPSLPRAPSGLSRLTHPSVYTWLHLHLTFTSCVCPCFLPSTTAQFIVSLSYTRTQSPMLPLKLSMEGIVPTPVQHTYSLLPETTSTFINLFRVGQINPSGFLPSKHSSFYDSIL